MLILKCLQTFQDSFDPLLKDTPDVPTKQPKTAKILALTFQNRRPHTKWQEIF